MAGVRKTENNDEPIYTKVMTDIYNNIEFYPWPEPYSPRSGEINTEPKKPIEES